MKICDKVGGKYRDGLTVLRVSCCPRRWKHWFILDFEQAALIAQNKVLDLNPNMSVITLNINGPSVSINRQNCQAVKIIQPYAICKKYIWNIRIHQDWK